MQFLVPILVVVAVSVVLRLLFAATRKPVPKSADGALLLRYPAGVAVIGGAAIGFGAMIGLVGGLHLVPTTGDEALPWLVGFFALLGLPLLLMGTVVGVRVSDGGVAKRGMLGRARELRWEEVRAVRFSATSELVLRSEAVTIRANTLLRGFDELVEEVKRRLDPELSRAALEAIEASRSRQGGSRR